MKVGDVIEVTMIPFPELGGVDYELGQHGTVTDVCGNGCCLDIEFSDDRGKYIAFVETDCVKIEDGKE